MPLDQLFVPDMAELFYAAVRALKYCGPSGNHPLEVLTVWVGIRFSQRYFDESDFDRARAFPGGCAT